MALSPGSSTRTRQNEPGDDDQHRPVRLQHLRLHVVRNRRVPPREDGPCRFSGIRIHGAFGPFVAGGHVCRATQRAAPIDRRARIAATALNLPNIDINLASTTPEMRAYTLNILAETVRLAGELGARGVIISPGKASPLFPAPEKSRSAIFSRRSISCVRLPRRAAPRCGSRTCRPPGSDRRRPDGGAQARR